MSDLELIIHPIRSRIIRLLAKRELTTEQIGKLLSDIPQATLYRNIKKLYDNQVIRITKEEKVRGTVRKTYTLDKSKASFTPEQLASMQKDELIAMVTNFTALLLSDFNEYLDNKHNSEPYDDFKILQRTVYLTKDDYKQVLTDIDQLLESYTNKISQESRLYQYTDFLLPDLHNKDGRKEEENDE